MSGALGIGAERFALLIGLSLFFGFAYEEFFAGQTPRRPGGVRTFPMLAVLGGLLYALEPQYAAAFIAGAIVLGAWTFAYVRAQYAPGASGDLGFIVPVCNLLAYTLGAVALTQPLWVSVAVAVFGVVLLGGERRLHEWAARVPPSEVQTAGKFLVLIGIVLPLLAGRPPIPHTTITPFGVWLAVVAVSTISYVSYLLQRYVLAGGGSLVAALLGGMYSSTATTVVLARRARESGMTAELQAGVAAATGMMFVRVLIVCAIFNAPLAKALLVPMLVPAALIFGYAWLRARGAGRSPAQSSWANPLQLSTALTFAGLMVIVSLATGYVHAHLGGGGVLALAAVVGITDIDPFVLGLAQGGTATIGIGVAALAIVIATASNNLLKAVYAMVFAGGRKGIPATVTLAVIAIVGLLVGYLAVR